VLIRSAAGPADALPGTRGVLSPPSIGALTQPQPGAMLIANPRAVAVAGVLTTQATATAAPALEPPPEPTIEPTAEPEAPPPAEVQLPAEAAPLPPTDRLVIPRIRLDTKVVDVGVLPSGEMETAAFAAGRLAGSAQAGEAGNMVLAGHDDIQGEVFRWLPEMQVGDQFTVYRGDQEFTYRVEIRTIVREDGATAAQRRDNAKWMEPVDEPVATLISCYPYRVDTHRIIVRARLVA
jgi:sortase A